MEKIRDARQAPPLVIGGVAHAALQPYPEAYGKSAAWRITVDPKALAGVANAYLDIKYQGDVGRLFVGAQLIDDQFWYGPDWVVGLKGRDLSQPFTLTVLPLRADAPVYIDDAYRPKADQVAIVQSVTVVPEYELTLDGGTK